MYKIFIIISYNHYLRVSYSCEANRIFRATIWKL